MAKNDGMDALGALVGLGILGSVLGGVSDADTIRRMTASGKSPIHTLGQQEQHQGKTTSAEGAKAVKEIYDSYVAAGFNEVQAFELLKAVLTAHKTN